MKKKTTKKQVKVEDLAPKQDPKGGILMDERSSTTTSLNLNSTTTTLTSVNTNTWTGKS